MSTARFAFVLYARVPRRGAVKTRMIPRLDADEALALHVALVEDSLDLLRGAASAADAVPYVALSEPWPPGRERSGHRLSRAMDDLHLLPQRGNDLGERLCKTCDDLLERGHTGVIIIGSDSPTLPPTHLVQARRSLLRGADVVVGPTEDGGYDLIGVARSLPGLFEKIAWGTASVFADTMAAAHRLGVQVDLLPRWYDVDRPADLVRLYREAHHGGGTAARTTAIAAALIRGGRLEG